MNQRVIKALSALGIGKGDILYIASDITSFGIEVVNAKQDINECFNELISGLQNLVGDSGTLMFPIYSWDFNKGKSFDIRYTVGGTGALSNWILKNRPDFIRTAHPIYSFMVWGKDANMLASMNNIDCFGQFSPFGYMYKCDAKMIFFNVPIRRGVTFTHYVEESLQVPYRYFKPFSAKYIDSNGIESNRTYVMYVRDMNIKSKEYMPDSFYKDIVKEIKFDSFYIKLLGSRDTFRLTADDLLNNGGKNIYKFENYELDWSNKSYYKNR
ncbi:aminoglycoside N3'-acetyltransferase [Campylobacter vicugnae]|uniref:Aminoglycoside N(3)-acetyltransferase n=1 Tax=Campylobacter vicugnae TaxID=1660076 RepID=A0A1X9SZT6_9BACT|nr:AAC(3) family N-acetyltransferase [Campylobacter sp. RM8964]ARR01715.1 aminoglycoside N3'-acetyltransferase [Campylobacter sp. RM8964]